MNSGKTIFSDMKFAAPSLLIAACSLLVTHAFPQSDSTFSVLRSGVEAKFQFIKFSKLDQFKTVRGSMLPIYGFNQGQYNRIKGLLVNFAEMENEYRLLLNNYREKDVVFAAKEKTLTERANLEEERAKNFENAYHKVMEMNAKLNDTVKNAERLALREHRKRKLKSILVGVVALSAGIVIGVTVR